MVKRSTVIIIALVAFALGAGAGVGVWIMISGGSGEPSADVQSVAPTLSLGGGNTTSETPTPRNKVIPSRFLQAPEETPEATPIPSEPIDYARALYRINPDLSEVQFILQEDLRGVRIDVIGITNQVAGDFIVDYTDPTLSQVGAIAINARTLETDNSFRNQAIRGQILRSAEATYEFITFTPTGITGLPQEAITASGDALEFEIVGDLKILETTREVTFMASVTPTTPDQLTGTATTTILWRDWSIRIPNAPGVANITEEITLTLNFVADLVETETADSTDAQANDLGYSVGLFRISTESSVARFILQEDLRGTRIDVVGITNQIAGDIIVNLADPTQSQLGGIAINARTLETDNGFRNQAIRGQILRSAEAAYEFITFAPTSITGLPTESISGLGQSLTFQVVGDLTIIGNTRPVTFDVTVTLDTPEALSGTATTTILWADWGIRIPSVPSVANISNEVVLSLDFIADLIDSQ